MTTQANSAVLLHTIKRHFNMDTNGLTESLEKNHALLVAAAKRVPVIAKSANNDTSDSHNLEKVLQDLGVGDAEFCEKVRERMMVVANANAAKANEMELLGELVKNLREEDISGDSPDYETQIMDLWRQAKSQGDGSADQAGTAAASSEYLVEVRDTLKLGTEQVGGNGDDSDEELTVINNGGSGDQWICPITRVAMVEPVTSKSCGHSFSKAAILSHLRIKRTCPVPGCTNNAMTPHDLKDNLGLAQQVRRQNRRHDARREHLSMTQALVDVDADEDDDDDSAGTPAVGGRSFKRER
jgi:E3 SUMO-protein ligase NSE2